MPVWLRNDARLLPALLSKEGEKIGPEKNPGGFRKFLLGLQKRVHEPKGKKREFSPEEFSEQLCRSRGADGRGLWEEE
jgi:hypothetical protein